MIQSLDIIVLRILTIMVFDVLNTCSSFCPKDTTNQSIERYSMQNSNVALSPQVTKLSASALFESNFKGESMTNPDLHTRPVRGVSPTTQAFIVCGECGDDGGGSSGQCACDK